METGWAKQFGSAAIAAFLAVGLQREHGQLGPRQPHGDGAGQLASANGATSATKAAELRASLNYLMGEHILLASSATGAALAGREAQFKAAAAALDGNSVDIAKAIGSVYGQGAQDAFLPLWRRHIGFAVDYTVGVATKDKAKQDKAVTDLVQYTQDFGAFLASANPNLPKDAVAGLVKTHVLTLKDVIDAQAAGDQAKAFTATRTAYAHMGMIADPLAGAIVKQFPDKFPGSTMSAAAGLRSTLTMAFQEHTYLAARATGAALGARDPEFKAAAGRARRERRGHLEGDRLRLRPGRAGRLPAPLAAPHRLRGGLHGRRRDQGPGQAAEGRGGPGGILPGLRRLPRLGQPESPEGRRGRAREGPHPDAQAGDRRPGGRRPAEGVHDAPLGDRPHADDRRPAGGGDREAVPAEVRRVAARRAVHSTGAGARQGGPPPLRSGCEHGSHEEGQPAAGRPARLDASGRRG